jgi:hypothetical protein
MLMLPQQPSCQELGDVGRGTAAAEVVLLLRLLSDEGRLRSSMDMRKSFLCSICAEC